MPMGRWSSSNIFRQWRKWGLTSRLSAHKQGTRIFYEEMISSWLLYENNEIEETHHAWEGVCNVHDDA